MATFQEKLSLAKGLAKDLKPLTIQRLEDFEDFMVTGDRKYKEKVYEIINGEERKSALLTYVEFCIQQLNQKNWLLLHYPLCKGLSKIMDNRLAKEHKYRVWGMQGTVSEIFGLDQPSQEKKYLSFPPLVDLECTATTNPPVDVAFSVYKSVFYDLMAKYTF